jgi:hypothetical protein
MEQYMCPTQNYFFKNVLIMLLANIPNFETKQIYCKLCKYGAEAIKKNRRAGFMCVLGVKKLSLIFSDEGRGTEEERGNYALSLPTISAKYQKRLFGECAGFLSQ